MKAAISTPGAWRHNSGLLTPAETHDQLYDADLVAIPRDRLADVFGRLGQQFERGVRHSEK